MDDSINTDSESLNTDQNVSDSSSESDSEDKRKGIRSELASMSFAELIKLKQQLGTKTYNEAMFGEGTSKPIKKPQRAAFKRENKNRPRETTAKKQVPLLGRTKSKKLDTNQVRDPRFDDKCGEYDRKKFKEDYGFVSEIRENELVELKKQLKEKSLAVEEKKKIKLLIQRLNNKLVEEKKTKQKDMAKTEAEQTVKAARKKGQTPFYASKRERRAQELVQQYVELKEEGEGKLNKHLEKRRKKKKSRDMKAVALFQ